MQAITMLFCSFAFLTQIIVETIQTLKTSSIDWLCARIAPRRSCMSAAVVPLVALVVCEQNFEEIVRAIMRGNSTMPLDTRRLLFGFLCTIEAALAERKVSALATLEP